MSFWVGACVQSVLVAYLKNVSMFFGFEVELVARDGQYYSLSFSNRRSLVKVDDSVQWQYRFAFRS